MRGSTTCFLFAVLLLVAARLGQIDGHLADGVTPLDKFVQVVVVGFCLLTAVAGVVLRIREVNQPAAGEEGAKAVPPKPADDTVARYLSDPPKRPYRD